jgi:hypothetical protein
MRLALRIIDARRDEFRERDGRRAVVGQSMLGVERAQAQGGDRRDGLFARGEAGLLNALAIEPDVVSPDPS